MHKPGRGAWLAALYAALLVPLLIDSPYWLGVAVLFFVYGAINLGWALLIGTAGILTFAPLAIVGISGYTAAVLAREGVTTSPVLLILAAAAAGGLVGLAVSLPALRLKGVYFALLTLGLGEIARTVVAGSDALGGSTGLSGVPRLVPVDIDLSTAAKYGYYAGLALLIGAVVCHRYVANGRLGLLLRTSRESEDFADSLGIGLARTRAAVLAVTGGLFGTVGGFYVAYYGSISPQIFGTDRLLLLLAMVVVGGSESAAGVLGGTALLLVIDQAFVEYGSWRFIAEALVMLAVILLSPRGLAGMLPSRKSRTDALPPDDASKAAASVRGGKSEIDTVTIDGQSTREAVHADRAALPKPPR